MRTIRDDLLRCVFYVAIKPIDGAPQVIGTAFTLSKLIPGGTVKHVAKGLGHGMMCNYVVTAKHVIEAARNKGVQDIYLRLNTRDGGSTHRFYDINEFQLHPDADVAVLPTFDPVSHDHIAWNIDDCATPERMKFHDVGVGSEVTIVGLFRYHKGDARNTPIVRTGNIAGIPAEAVNTGMGPMEVIFVEARSTGGLSGSPVFVNLGRLVAQDDGTVSARPLAVSGLLGLMHGHFDELGEDQQPVNVGIGMVVPVTKILELINSPFNLEVEAREADQAR